MHVSEHGITGGAGVGSTHDAGCWIHVDVRSVGRESDVRLCLISAAAIQCTHRALLQLWIMFGHRSARPLPPLSQFVCAKQKFWFEPHCTRCQLPPFNSASIACCPADTEPASASSSVTATPYCANRRTSASARKPHDDSDTCDSSRYSGHEFSEFWISAAPSRHTTLLTPATV